MDRQGVMDTVEGMSLVDDLVRHELAIHELYQAFADAVPSSGEFWSRLSHEEQSHAEILRRLNKKIFKGSVSVAADRFNIRQIRAAAEFVNEHTATVRERGIDPGQALHVAHAIEKHMIEGNTFAVMDTDDPELRTVLDRLLRHTAEHLARIEEAARSYTPDRKGWFARLRRKVTGA